MTSIASLSAIEKLENEGRTMTSWTANDDSSFSVD